jgi:putative ABC transport system substrate-binding protein
MKRRDVLTLLVAAASWLALARAQETGRVARIGLIVPTLLSYRGPAEDSLHHGLRDLGWKVGHNCVIEVREFGGDLAQVPLLASEMINRKVDIPVAFTLQIALRVQSVAKTTPIVVVAAGDPVAIGAAQSLSWPGGTITGLSLISPELAGKRVELLARTLPRASRIAVLQNPDTPLSPKLAQAATSTAKALGLTARVFDMRRSDEIASTFDAINAWPADGIALLDDAMFYVAHENIADAALTRKLPLACPFREMARAGCRFSYSANVPECFYRAATSIDKILKGANPAELPFEQPTRFELVLNLKTAATLGIQVPAALLPDEVIE